MPTSANTDKWPTPTSSTTRSPSSPRVSASDQTSATSSSRTLRPLPSQLRPTTTLSMERRLQSSFSKPRRLRPIRRLLGFRTRANKRRRQQRIQTLAHVSPLAKLVGRPSRLRTAVLTDTNTKTLSCSTLYQTGYPTLLLSPAKGMQLLSLLNPEF